MSHEIAFQQRPIVLDVEQKRRKRRSRRTQRSSDETSNSQEVIEIQHVIRAVKEYARRTHSLGALQGAKELSSLASSLRELSKTVPAAMSLANDAELRAENLREYAQQVYDDE